VRDEDERVRILKVYEDDILFVCLNLYPYNPGHLLVVPKEHIENYLDLSRKELIHVSRTIQGLQLLLNDLYNPHGYNIGLNEGRDAGGSIEHLHFHIVPRYGAELGYIDIVGKTRVIVEGLKSVKEKIEKKIDEYLNKEFFDNF